MDSSKQIVTSNTNTIDAGDSAPSSPAKPGGNQAATGVVTGGGSAAPILRKKETTRPAAAAATTKRGHKDGELVSKSTPASTSGGAGPAIVPLGSNMYDFSTGIWGDKSPV